MSDSLSNLILSLTPEDGSTIGNGAMMALLREQVSTLTDDDYAAARDALVDEGLLGRGKERGRSIVDPSGGMPECLEGSFKDIARKIEGAGASDDGADTSDHEAIGEPELE